MEIRRLGTVPYADGLALQESLLDEVRRGETPETLLLLEHPSVYTTGRRDSSHNLLDEEVAPVAVNRGGDVTWHGPGQLVAYPILDLSSRGRDLHRYLRFLEEWVVEGLGRLGIASFRVPGRTGVWTSTGKICSIGVGVRRWITMHGIALNVCADLSAFSRIHPCGIAGCPVTSVSHLAGRRVTVDQVADLLSLLFPAALDRLLPVEERQDFWYH